MSNSEDDKSVSKNTKVKNIFKAILPLMAVAAPLGDASSRNFSSLRKDNKSVVVTKNKADFPFSLEKKSSHNPTQASDNISLSKPSVFSAFSKSNSLTKTQIKPTDNQSNAELLKIISDSASLTSSINKVASISGDLFVLGSKTFLHTSSCLTFPSHGHCAPANNPPVNTLPSVPTVNEDDTNVAIADNINISDANNDNQTITLTFTGGTGSITTGLPFSSGDGADDTSMSFSGSIANINTALDTLTFTPTANLAGTNAGAIQMQLSDGKGGTDNDTVQFDIVAVNDDPTQTGTFPTDIIVTGNIASNLDFSGLTLSDIDSAANNLVMTFTASAGILAASDSGSVTIGGSGTSTLTLTGSITNIDTYINTISNIQYTSAADANGNDAATVSAKINDGGNVGTGGGADIALGTVNIDIPAPQIDSATYNENTKSLLVTGTNFIAKSGAINDVDITKLTLTGEGGGSFTLTGQSSNVEITSATSFTVIIGGTDVSNVEALLNTNGTSADDSTSYNLNAADDFISAFTDADTSDTTNAITVSGWPSPSITATTYDANAGVLVVTGIDFEENGSGDDVTAANFTFTGEGGSTYTLTDTADVERDSVTQFTFTLSATDKAAVNAIINKDGTASTSATTYNIAASDNFISAVTLANTADNSNAITVSNVAIPTIISATYDGSTGIFVVTGEDIPNINGATNDIDASMFTFKGEDSNTYTLVGTSDVERISPSSFSLTLDATDKAQIQKLINKAGTSATGGVTYNLAGAENWALGADPAVNIVDSTSNVVTVSNVPVPSITSATYNEDTKALMVTGVNFVALGGATNDVDVTKFIFTGEAGGAFTLTGQSSNVDITSATSFTITVGGTDVVNIEALLNVNGSSSNDNTTYNLSVLDDFNAANTDGDTADTTNAINVSGWPQPAVTSTTYDVISGVLVVTGIDFSANGGGLDVDASSITFTGEDGTTYTLTDTSDVNIDSAIQFTITLSATDREAVNALLNNNGTSLTGGANYNISFADNFMTGVTIGDTSDISGNGMTVSNVFVPAITATTYDATTGVLAVSGTNIPNISGSNNDIDASLFTFTGEGAGTYTLIGTPDVERTSATGFSLTLDITDKAAVQQLINKNGTNSTSGTTYNIAAAEDWAKGAAASVNVVDALNTMIASNIASPSITSAIYNSNTGVISVTGTNLLQKSGTSNDIDLSTLTLTGEAGGTYTLTTTTDVELTNATSFSTTLAGADKTQVDLLLHINGTQSDDNTSYNLAAAEDWNTGADPAINISDTTNAITVNGWPVPSITSSIYDEKLGQLVVTGANFSVNGGGFDIDASKLTFTGQANATYTLTDTSDVNITNATTFSLTLSVADIVGVNAILNKNGTTSADATTYNLGAEDDFITVVTQGDSSDSTASIVVSKVAPVVSTPNNAISIDAINQTIGGTYTTDGIIVGLYLDANNDGISDGGGALATDNVAGGTWSISASLSDDTVFNYVVIADFGNANESSHINVPTITEDSTGPTGYSATIDSNITASNASALTFTFSGAEVGTTYNYTLTSSGGGGSITGSGTISTVTDKISNVNVSSLNDGTLTLSVTLTDLASNIGIAASDTAIKNIIPPNVAPVIAQGSSVTVSMAEDNSPTAFSLSLTASDGNNDALTWSISNTASNGVANVSGAGASSNVSYVPTANFTGTDSFAVQVSDSNGGSDSITVNVTVLAVNDLPTGVVLITGDAKEKATLTVSNTLADIEGLGTISYTWKRSNTTVSSGNTYTLTSDDIDNFISVIASYVDGKGSVESVTSNSFGPIINVNDAPVISGSPTTKVNQDASYSFVPTASDADKDTLTFSIENKPSWASFNASTGGLTGTPDNSHIGTTNAIKISVSDGAETVSLTPFSIEVVNVNDAPVISGTPITKVNQDTSYNFVPTASDADKDTLTFSIENKPSWASFNTSTGGLTGTPDNSHIGTSNAIKISVSDAIETVSLTTFSIEVVNVNDAPVISGTPIGKVNQDASYNFVPTASDVDKDTLIFSIENKPSWASFNTSTGGLTGTPDNSHIGTTNAIKISVSDAIETVSLTPFSIEVVNVNDAPVISGSPITKVNQDTSYSFVPTASDADKDTLTFSIENKPSWTSFNSLTGGLTGTPENSHIGTTNAIKISVSDGVETVSLTPFSIEVVNVNDAPVISGSPITKINQDTSYSFVPTASDADKDTLTFSIENKPSWASFNTLTGGLTGTPENSHIGTTNTIKISVSDGVETVSLTPFSIEVVNVNDAPVISGSPITKVNQDTSYSFVPTASDADKDTLTFSIENKPSWASFNASTGGLSGTPSREHVGMYNDIKISVTDGIENVLFPAFIVEVTLVNTAPTAEDSHVELDEDTSFSINLIALDIDENELTYNIESLPKDGSLVNQGDSWLYTPEADFNGTDVFTFKVNDSTIDSNIATVNITILPVNDKPIAQDNAYVLPVSSDGRYILDVIIDDTDIDGDELNIIGASASVGTVFVENNKLIYQAIDTVNEINFEYVIQDENKETDSAHVSLTIEQTSDADLPTIIVPSDVEVNAIGLFTKVELGVATAIDKSGEPIAVSLIDNNTLFEPGEHLVYWQAKDSEDNASISSQKVAIYPLISIEKDIQSSEGTRRSISVYLNGQPPQYPITITYSVSGTADLNDHDLIDGEIIIEEGLEGVIDFTIFEDNIAEGNETIVINLDNNLNLGNNSTHTLTIVEENIAPLINTQVSQMNEIRFLVVNNEDVVRIKANVTDANPNDNHSISWTTEHEGIINNSLIENEFTFNPQGLSPAIYQISVKAQDDANVPLETQKVVYIEVTSQLTELGSGDSDGDLIPDNQEGYSDSDNDGIPDYLDAINECNVMQEQLQSSNQYLVEGEPGICLRKGSTVSANETGGVQLLESELPSDEESQNIGGLFDFIASGLPQQGQTYKIVFPQILPIPQGAVYRKFKNGVWVDFVENEKNAVSSTEGEAGYCPPPGQDIWTSGLTEGHWCVQLTIEDGGPNDDDKAANATIVDPGGVAVLLNNNNLPVANPDMITMNWDDQVIIDVLANDTDTDNDDLKISGANVDFGDVAIENNQLVYQTLNDFIGMATIQYGISDNNGGSAYSIVEVTVVNNIAPIANDDIASTNDKTPINIAVLTNDIDADGDVLTITQASVEFGNVIINTDQTLTYTPKLGFDGIDNILYTIADDKSATSKANVIITVKAYVPTEIKNTSSGSTGGAITLLLTTIIMLRRKKKLIVRSAAFAALTIASSNVAANEQVWLRKWSVDAELSSITVKDNENLNKIPSSQIKYIDDSDSAWSLGVGYQFSSNWKLTAKYIDLGESSVILNTESLDPSEYHQVVSKATPVLGNGLSLEVNYQFFKKDNWLSGASVGVFNWKNELKSTYENDTIMHKESGTDIYLGINTGYQFNLNWQLALVYTRYFISQNDVDSLGLKLTYRF